MNLTLTSPLNAGLATLRRLLQQAMATGRHFALPRARVQLDERMLRDIGLCAADLQTLERLGIGRIDEARSSHLALSAVRPASF